MKAPLYLLSLGIFTLLSSCDSSPPAETATSQLEELTKTESSQSSSQPTWPPASDQVDANLLKENYLVILDDSGSMKGQKIHQAKQALKSLAETLPQEHNLGLIFLNRNATVPLTDNDRKAFSKTVKEAHADGWTPLRETCLKAYKMMTEKASTQRGYGAYHMIIVTDGESSDGSAMPLVKAIVEKTAIQVHVIGFHLENHEMNQPQFVDYQTAGNSEELARAFKAVAAETDEFSDPKEFSR